MTHVSHSYRAELLRIAIAEYQRQMSCDGEIRIVGESAAWLISELKRLAGPGDGEWNTAIEAAAQVCYAHRKRMNLLQARTAGDVSAFLEHTIRGLKRFAATASPEK